MGTRRLFPSAIYKIISQGDGTVVTLPSPAIDTPIKLVADSNQQWQITPLIDQSHIIATIATDTQPSVPLATAGQGILPGINVTASGLGRTWYIQQPDNDSETYEIHESTSNLKWVPTTDGTNTVQIGHSTDNKQFQITLIS